MEHAPDLPPPPTVETCYRHPGVQTAVHCTRCGRPICTDCMIPAPVGHQCPECVAQARAEYRRGPGRRVAVAQVKGVSVTKILIAAIVAVYVLEVARGGVSTLISGPGSQTMFRVGAMYPPAVASGEYWRLFTAMFLHFGIFHLAVNAYSLFVLGSVLEREIGRWRFLAVYLVSGLAASAISYTFSPVETTLAAGASGAIFGLFGAVFAVNYRRRHTAAGAVAMRAIGQILILNVLINVVFASYLDWRAHIGGAVAGVLLGFAADPPTTRATRTATTIAGFVAVAAGIVAVVAWRTSELRELFPVLS